MKNIFKVFSLLFMVTLFVGCQPDEYAKPDIALTPVYSMTSLSGTNAPLSVNIYKEKTLLVRYTSSILLYDFDTKDYIDASIENSTNEAGAVVYGSYDVSVTALETVTSVDQSTGDKVSVNNEYRYHLTGSKMPGSTCTLTCSSYLITSDGETNTGNETFTTIVSETEVYN